MQFNDDSVEVGKMLKDFRIKVNMTQEDMAEQLILSRTSISKIETGNRTIMLDEYLKWITVTKQKAKGIEYLFGKDAAEKAFKQLQNSKLINDQTDET